MTAIGINESDSELGENKRDIVSVLQFYRNQENGNIVHFLIDEVDGEMFTEQYSEKVKNFLTEDEMVQSSKVVFAMQSMAKQRSINSKGYCFKQTGMTLLPLKISMRMTGNIYNLNRIATESILQSTTIRIKHQVNTVGKPILEEKNLNSDQNLQEVDTTKNNVNSALEPDKALAANSNLHKTQTNQTKEDLRFVDVDTDIEMCKANSPQLFVNDSDIRTTEIKTDFTYPYTKNGVLKVKDNEPTIIFLNSSFNLDLGECGVILVDILTQHLEKNFNTCILCNSQQELSLVKYSLEMLLRDSHPGTFVYYTPSLDTRLPDDEEKDNVWSTIQTSSSVLVTDHKGMRGCEAKSVVAFVNQDDEYKNHVLVEILTRAVADLCLLVLPNCKSKNVKRENIRTFTNLFKKAKVFSKVLFKPKDSKKSLPNVTWLWKDNPEVLVKSYPSDFQSTRCPNIDFNTQYEEFKKKNQNPSIEENIQR